jgi:hypothetical protein
VNLSVFESALPIELPYYDRAMCEFVCRIPEEHLARRKLQIAYVRREHPELARLPWQAFAPLNLLNFDSFRSPLRWPGRLWRRARRALRERASGRRLVERNWELQFLGEANDRDLRDRLFERGELRDLVPEEVTGKFYDKFTHGDALGNAHPVGMLLTLSSFASSRR